MQAFNAPHSIMLLEVDATGMYDTAAEDMGKIFISTELGGGGTATAATSDIAKRGVQNVLKHIGIFAGAPEIGETVDLDMPNDRCFVSCATPGLLEMCKDLGDVVKAGDLLAKVHDITRTGAPPTEYESQIDGIVTGRHFPGLIAMGDVISVVAVPVQ